MGEEKRRRQAGTYPRGEAVPDFAEHRHHLRQLFPKIAEREIGLAWMRSEGAGTDVRDAPPEAWEVMPGTLQVHLLFGNATLSGAIPVGRIDEAVAAWQACGMSRNATRDAIATELALSRHMLSDTGNSLLIAALGLPFTSEMAGLIKTQMAGSTPMRLTYEIEHFELNGRRAVNFRLMLSPQDAPVPRASLAAMPPTAFPA
jgi:hypothetical protein